MMETEDNSNSYLSEYTSGDNEEMIEYDNEISINADQVKIDDIQKLNRLNRIVDFATRKRNAAIAKTTPSPTIQSANNKNDKISVQQIKKIIKNNFELPVVETTLFESNNSDVIKFKCQYCAQGFKSQGWFDKHIRLIHQNESKKSLPENVNNENLGYDYEKSVEPEKESILNVLQKFDKKIDQMIDSFNEKRLNLLDTLSANPKNLLKISHLRELTLNIFNNFDDQLKLINKIQSTIDDKRTKVTKISTELSILLELIDQIHSTGESNQSSNVEIHNDNDFDELILIATEIETIDQQNDDNPNEKHNENVEIFDEINDGECDVDNTIAKEPNKRRRSQIHIPDEIQKAIENACPDENDKYSCIMCPAKMSKRICLRPHYVRKHINIRSKKCPHCEVSFNCTGDLTRHIRTHTGDRPFKCTFPNCTVSFCSSGDLFRHARNHTKTIYPLSGAFLCSVCGKNFDRKYDLQRHEATHQPLNDPDFPTFVCEFCERKFFRKDQLKNHIIWHLKIKAYQCRYCHERFLTNAVRKVHEREHALKEFRCEYCEEVFVEKEKLEDHLMNNCTEVKALSSSSFKL